MSRITKSNAVKAKKTVSKKSRSSSKGGGGSAVQKILDFCLFLERCSGTFGAGAPRKQVLAMSGVKANTFQVTLSGMKKKGLATFDKDFIYMTTQGRAQANVADFAMDNGSVQEQLKKRFKIGGKAAALFDLLTDGLVHDRSSLLDGLGIKKNTGAVMLSNLKKNGVIGFDKDTIKMTDMCFPFGRPTST